MHVCPRWCGRGLFNPACVGVRECQVYVGGQSDEQARAQFTMWSLFPTNLIISQNVLAWSAYALETYSNAEVIAINQDPFGSPAQRIVGAALTFPCSSADGGLAVVTAVACKPSDPAQQWTYDPSTVCCVGSDAWEGLEMGCGRRRVLAWCVCM